MWRKRKREMRSWKVEGGETKMISHLSSTAIEVKGNQVPSMRINNRLPRPILRMNNPKNKKMK